MMILILPCGRSHNAASTIDGHPAATAALWGVMVHAEIVSQLVCQSHGCTQWVLRVILNRGRVIIQYANYTVCNPV